MKKPLEAPAPDHAISSDERQPASQPASVDTRREQAVLTIPARIHGSYILETLREHLPARAFVGFHGYGENAGIHLRRLRQIAQSDDLLCSVQSLHLFYNRRTRDVVGSWMTRQHRLQAIEDNLEYVQRILSQIDQAFDSLQSRILVGFSQGAAMAYRVAARFPGRFEGLVILAGDVPPDVAEGRPGSLPPVLVGQGDEDPWYDEAKLGADLAALRRLQAPVQVCRFRGAHQWTEDFALAAKHFVQDPAGAVGGQS